jgi:hypothetical protein
MKTDDEFAHFSPLCTFHQVCSQGLLLNLVPDVGLMD